MRSRKKTLWLVFIVMTVIVAVITMMVIDNNAPLHIQSLRLSVFGKIWSSFVMPGVLLFLLPVGMMASLLCSIGIGSCSGIMDGGPVDTYIFFFISVFVGLLYTFILMSGVHWVVSRLKQRK